MKDSKAVKLEPSEPIDFQQLPRMTFWDTTGHANNSQNINDAYSSYEYDESVYNTPNASTPRGHDACLYPDSPERYTIRPTRIRSRPDADTTDALVPPPEEAVAASLEMGLEMSKLKGLVWPGMNLFDSATPEMRRKRNQRKDGSVLEHMKSTSAAVEPAELVWTLEGDLQRTRDIYASPSVGGSPVCLPGSSCSSALPRFAHVVHMMLTLGFHIGQDEQKDRRQGQEEKDTPNCWIRAYKEDSGWHARQKAQQCRQSWRTRRHLHRPGPYRVR